jgi:hypothetical protein
MKILFLITLWVISVAIQAETYVQVNGVSVHDRAGFNELNYGTGIETSVSDRSSVAVGWYRNSEYRGSVYAYGRYAVYKKDSWDIGIAVGAVTGYQRAAVTPMAFPEICYAWTCAMFAPRVEATGANVVGLRLRIPIN